jgi:hypothetical protein
MSLKKARSIARALLYEGYLLYPYHPQSTKNRQRWTFGGVYPEKYARQTEGSDASEMLSECLIRGTKGARLSVRLKFLQLVARSLSVAGFDQWEEAVEREVLSGDLALEPLHSGSAQWVNRSVPFEFPESRRFDSSEKVERIQKKIQGRMEISVTALNPELYRLSVRILNCSLEDPQTRSEALLFSMISTHALFCLQGAEFLSQIDPPDQFQEPARACRNVGLWPILVGEPGAADLMLASPIILYDYPQIAAESPGDLFDNAEIDEILSLRILTLTESEKTQIRAADQMGRALLERTENLSADELLRMHGALRELKPSTVQVGSTEIRPGSQVKLCPHKGSDILDIALRGMIAVVDSIEQDLEGRCQIAVVLRDDPGRDLGQRGQPGHRFFFRPDEVEPL